MRKFRKLIAMITTLTMVGCMMTTMSMSVAADDTAPTYKITIDKAPEGQTYEAYQVFSGSLDTNNNLVVSDWGSGVNGTDLLAELKTTTFSNADISFTSCTNAPQVAEVLSKIVSKTDDANLFASIVSKHLTDTKITDLTSVQAGYYLIKGGSGDNITKYVLSVADNVTVSLKVGTPTVMKKVKENTKTLGETTFDVTEFEGLTGADYIGYNDVADYNIGDEVPFKLFGSMPQNIDDYKAYRYIFHDNIDATHFDTTSIEFDKVEVVSKDGLTRDTIATAGYNVNIDKNNGKITVTFNNIKDIESDKGTKINIDKDSKIEVSYTAVLDTDANIGLDGQQNEVYLEYSNNPNWDGTGSDSNTPSGNPDTPTGDSDTPVTPGEGDSGTPEDTTNTTPKDKVIVFTYQLNINKIDKNTQKSLKGVVFSLKDDNSKSAHYGEYVQIDSTGAVSGWTANKSEASNLTTDDKGNVSVKGLDDGTYILTEEQPLANYNPIPELKLTISGNTITVVSSADATGDDTYHAQNWTGTADKALTGLTFSIEGDNSVYDGDVDKGTVDITVENSKGSTLPITGGIGTTMFYMVGGILVVGAGVTLIAKKRAKNEQ